MTPTFQKVVAALRVWGDGALPRVNDSFSGSTNQHHDLGSPVTVSAGGGHIAVIDIEKRLFTWNQQSSSGTDGHSEGQLGTWRCTAGHRPVYV